jgi:hypothetical protein
MPSVVVPSSARIALGCPAQRYQKALAQGLTIHPAWSFAGGAAIEQLLGRPTLFVTPVLRRCTEPATP